MTEPRPPAKSRRVAITKLQRETATATDLIDLCTSMAQDGRLDEAEIAGLQSWLAENRASGLPAVAFLTETVEAILSDGLVTADEHDALYRAIERVLPPDLRESVRGTRKKLLAEEGERSRPVERLDYMVAGVRHEDRAEIIGSYLDEGDPVYLEREPDNRFSENAIAINIEEGFRIGYVPEELARDLAPLLDTGYQVRSRVKKILGSGRVPIPVIITDVYRQDAMPPGAERPSGETISDVVAWMTAPDPGQARESAAPSAERPRSGVDPAVYWVFGLVALATLSCGGLALLLARR